MHNTSNKLNKTACGHPNLNRLSDNSISGQKHAKNKVYKAFKSKKKELNYNSIIIGSNCRTACKGQGIRDPPHSRSNKLELFAGEKCTKRPLQYKKMYFMRQRGQTGEYFHDQKGLNVTPTHMGIISSEFGLGRKYTLIKI